MQKLLFIVLLIWPTLLFGQQNNRISRYQHCTFETPFRIKDHQIKAYLDTARYASHRIYCVFDKNGTYRIQLDYLTNASGKVEQFEKVFTGTFTMGNAIGGITIHGAHPFETPQIHIKETDENGYIMVRGFTFRFNEAHSFITRKKVYAACDGMCSLENFEQ